MADSKRMSRVEKYNNDGNNVEKSKDNKYSSVLNIMIGIFSLIILILVIIEFLI